MLLWQISDKPLGIIVGNVLSMVDGRSHVCGGCFLQENIILKTKFMYRESYLQRLLNFVSIFFFLVSIISTPDLIFLFEERDVSDF